MMELRCSRELAVKLGAVAPVDKAHHLVMKMHGDLLVRDETLRPLFMPWQLSKLDIAVEITPRSS